MSFQGLLYKGLYSYHWCHGCNNVISYCSVGRERRAIDRMDAIERHYYLLAIIIKFNDLLIRF